MQHVAGEASLLCSLSSPVASSLYPASAHSDLAFDSLAKAAMAFFQCCAGVLARIALASSPASSCPHCRRCASIVAELTFEGPAGAALAFAGVALAFCLHPAGIIAVVIAGIAPASSPLACKVFALIAHPSWCRLPFHHHRCRWVPRCIRCRQRPSSFSVA